MPACSGGKSGRDAASRSTRASGRVLTNAGAKCRADDPTSAPSGRCGMKQMSGASAEVSSRKRSATKPQMLDVGTMLRSSGTLALSHAHDALHAAHGADTLLDGARHVTALHVAHWLCANTWLSEPHVGTTPQSSDPQLHWTREQS